MAKDLRVLYVTSFSPDLFKASGRRLLESYEKIGSPGRMLVCHEGCPELNLSFKVELYDLGQDKFLQDWLIQNKNIIPKHLGGDLEPCKCPKRHIRHAKHEPGCTQDWMRRNASRWFRKVASWRYAADMAKVDILFWVDSDCEFVRPLSDAKILDYLKGTSLFYFRAHRPAIESGILGFDLRKQGRAIIHAVCNWYAGDRFHKEPRHDDGYALTQVVDSKKFSTVDAVPGKRPTNHVMTYSDMWQYLPHHKSTHGAGAKDGKGVMI